MRLRSLSFVFAFASAFAIASSADAATEEDGERTRESRQDDTRRPVALTINPLAFVIQRYGGNIEWSFARHHALVASGYVQSVPVEMVRPFAGELEIKDKSATPGFGGELGYRVYSGKRGADGLFLGGSFVAMPVAYPRLGAIDARSAQATVELQRIYGVGGAIDIGAQTVTSWGLTIGGGLGASFLAYDYPNDPSRLPYALPNVLPRLLLQTGYSF
jgi:hypothetical protein